MPSGGERQSGDCSSSSRRAAAALANPIHMFCQTSSTLSQLLRRQWPLLRRAGGCSHESDSPTQVALGSNLSLLLTLTHPENPRNPSQLHSLPNLPEMLLDPSVSPHFRPSTNKAHAKKRLFTKTKLSRLVTSEQSSTVRAGGLRLTVRHLVYGRAGSQPASLAHGPGPRSESSLETPNTRLCVRAGTQLCYANLQLR